MIEIKTIAQYQIGRANYYMNQPLCALLIAHSQNEYK